MNTAMRTNSGQSTSRGSSADAINASDISWLFVKMMRLVGAVAWRSTNGIKDDGTWLETLGGMCRARLELGVSRYTFVHQAMVRQGEKVWPPSALDFFPYCFPSDEELGLPTVDQAYNDACSGKWDRHPIVYLAAAKVGTYRLRTGFESATRKQYERAFAKLAESARRGDKLILPSVARGNLLDAPGEESRVAAKEDAIKYCRNIKAMLAKLG